MGFLWVYNGGGGVAEDNHLGAGLARAFWVTWGLALRSLRCGSLCPRVPPARKLASPMLEDAHIYNIDNKNNNINTNTNNNNNNNNNTNNNSNL